jgi:diguanylate cyclase (GGDEF)-like protein
MVRRPAHLRSGGGPASTGVERRLVGVCAVLLVLVMVIEGVAVFSAHRISANDHAQYVGKAMPLKSSVQDLVLQMVNEETGVRGYLISGTPGSLEPYTSGHREVHADLSDLRTLAAARPATLRLLSVASAQIRALEAFYATEVRQIRLGSQDQARRDALRGKKDFDAFRVTAARMLDDADLSVAQAERSQRRTFRAMVTLLALFGVVALVAGALVAVSAIRRATSGVRGLEHQNESLAEASRVLARQASTDPLTGLANHRAFNERLRQELERARRHSSELSLVLFDLDGFKAMNDTFGHAYGDKVLVTVAETLAAVIRAGEMAARIGGDEFAWILPETDSAGAFAAADRARAAIARALRESGTDLAVSAGVCDTHDGPDAESMSRLADGALYWAKAHGRDRTFRYRADVVKELSANELAENLRRSQTITGLRALARAVDAKDPSTNRHSERVAELVSQLAATAGWSRARIDDLHAAALVHDVGKIGVADAILLKPGRLSPAEYEEIKKHAELGAQIAGEVLTEEQAGWIRHHHERHDGSGYPGHLRAGTIPDGSRLIALADAWDVMTSGRPYSRPLSVDEALDECRRCEGTHFDPAAVSACRRLHDAPSDHRDADQGPVDVTASETSPS